jgi:hypothetical protein
MAGIDLETSLALAALVAREERPRADRCASPDIHLVLRPYGEGAALGSACAPGALELVGSPFRLAGGEVEVHRCAELGSAAVRDPALGLLAPEDLVAARRFEPGV